MRKRILSILLCAISIILMVDINAYAIELSDGTNVEIDENISEEKRGKYV